MLQSLPGEVVGLVATYHYASVALDEGGPGVCLLRGAAAWRVVSRAWRNAIDAWIYAVRCRADKVASLEAFPALRVVLTSCDLPLDEAMLASRLDVWLECAKWPRVGPSRHGLFGASRSPGSLCALELSGQDIDDASLSVVCERCHSLRALRVESCQSLERPRLSAARSLRVLRVEGSFRLDFQLLLDLGLHDVDVLHRPLAPTDAVQVVILNGRHAGRWVTASVIQPVAAYRYDIFVQRTHLYDHAIGFSNHRAHNIHRLHLRRRPDRDRLEDHLEDHHEDPAFALAALGAAPDG
mmetsp:Transcript_10297/g.32983  ORF Transcript_10297/g.32983 Transcript_10297/m.32983 type:complete len:296 (+) Transcript_10297:75-962(+)